MEPLNYFPEKPAHVKISLTNICNYKCIMCPNSSMKQTRGFMEDELAYKIIDECVAVGIRGLSLGSSGEVLLHKNFTKYLKYAKEKNLWVSTATNCSRLSPEMTDEILSLGIDRINLSVYSTNSEEHKKYCNKEDFEDVVRNVKYFLDRWYTVKHKVDVKMGFLKLEGINDEIAFRKFWEPITRKYGLEIDRKEAINWAGGINTLSDSILSRKWMIKKEDNKLALCFARIVPCSQMPSYVYILHDGTVHPCCNLLDSSDYPEMRFGNVKNSSIFDIWQSPRFKKFREKHFRCEVSSFKPCITCEARFKLAKITPASVFHRMFALCGR